jgi:predicted XRE-type DNA-binding protein
MPKIKKTVTKEANELAEALDLTPADAVEWITRHRLTEKIIDTAKKNRLTASQIAKGAQTSRARVTRILKGDTQGISIDVLLRVLGAAGQTIRITFTKAA